MDRSQEFKRLATRVRSEYAVESTLDEANRFASNAQLFLAKHLVLLAQNNDFRAMSSGFCRIEQSETHDRQ